MTHYTDKHESSKPGLMKPDYLHTVKLRHLTAPAICTTIPTHNIVCAPNPCAEANPDRGAEEPAGGVHLVPSIAHDRSSDSERGIFQP